MTKTRIENMFQTLNSQDDKAFIALYGRRRRTR